MLGFRGRPDQIIIQISETKLEAFQHRMNKSLKCLRLIAQPRVILVNLGSHKDVHITIFGMI